MRWRRSAAEAHAAVKRVVLAQLAVGTGGRAVPNIRNLAEFLLHGVRYVFVPERGEMTRGTPTLYAAPPLKGAVVESSEPQPVWPDPEGEARGHRLRPCTNLHPKQPGPTRCYTSCWCCR
jgi:hypothetical protein